MVFSTSWSSYDSVTISLEWSQKLLFTYIQDFVFVEMCHFITIRYVAERFCTFVDVYLYLPGSRL